MDQTKNSGDAVELAVGKDTATCYQWLFKMKINNLI
jgi:hypothetical protein